MRGGEDGRTWLRCLGRVHEPRLRLYAFPHSGGSPAFFRPWVPLLPAGVELWSIQLPGRENRIAERPLRRLSVLADHLTDVLGGVAPVPFAFFGHSLGGFVGFEVARRLRRRGRAGPRLLVVSGCRAPHVPDPRPPIHGLPDDEFLARLSDLNGTPADLLANRELMELIMPALRADSEMAETYAYEGSDGLNCPVAALAGLDDPIAPPALVEPWRRHTTGPFAAETFHGDHFFVVTSREAVLDRVGSACRSAMPPFV